MSIDYVWEKFFVAVDALAAGAHFGESAQLKRRMPHSI